VASNQCDLTAQDFEQNHISSRQAINNLHSSQGSAPAKFTALSGWSLSLCGWSVWLCGWQIKILLKMDGCGIVPGGVAGKGNGQLWVEK
jgi:hypothetical protein